MTDHLVRLYAFAVAILVFFVTWAVVAAHPWAPKAAPDPRVAALAARELRIHRESLAVKRLVEQRWAAYRSARAHQAQLIAAAPPVRVVTLPPLTVTRTS